MKPYYQDDHCTIYHGDCREILPTLGTFDLVLTDPPYGIGRDGSKPSTSSHGGRKAYEFKGWDKDAPPTWLLMLCLEKGRDSVIWGANYFPHVFPPSMGWLVWDKGQDICSSDCELAYSSRQGALRRKIINRVALQQDGASHPTQKPLALMKWAIQLFPEAKTILDPFMGSGTTLRAAKDLGLKAVGIELEEKYCEIAAKRLEQEVFTFEAAA